MVPDAINCFTDMKLHEVVFESEHKLIDSTGIVQEMAIVLYEKYDTE